MTYYTINNLNYIISQVNGQRMTIQDGLKSADILYMKEIYLCHIPKNTSEETLIPELSKFGEILQFRLCLSFSGLNRGYGFIIYKNQYEIDLIIKALNGFQIENQYIYAKMSENRRTLCLRKISKLISNDRVIDFVVKTTNPIEMKFRFDMDFKHVYIIYATHREAALSRRLLLLEITDLGPSAALYWAN